MADWPTSSLSPTCITQLKLERLSFQINYSRLWRQKIEQKNILPQLSERYSSEGVELRGCKETKEIIEVKTANEEDWSTEYLAPVLSVKIVGGIEEAIEHINLFGSSHTDSIVTENNEKVAIFFDQVDSSSVMHNLPTCWADGFEYGLGAEVGISTDKIHARGPVGLEGLTSQKFIVKGNSQLRGS